MKPTTSTRVGRPCGRARRADAPGGALALALAFTMLATAAGRAQDGGVVRCLDEGRGTVREVARDQCRGRVISAEEAERVRNARDERINRIVRDAARAPNPSERPAPGAHGLRHGTGFFIAENGTLLTNRHVAGRCQSLSATLHDGRTVDATLRAVAADADIAVMTVRTSPASIARFTTAPDLTSDALSIVGYPQNSPTPQVATMASAQRGTADLLIGQRYYALPGSVRPGHSGSPVLDRAGNVVGMVVASIRRRGASMADPPTPDERVAAIPNATVVAFLAQNGIAVQTAPPAREWTEAQILDRARRFVVRVNCTY